MVSILVAAMLPNTSRSTITIQTATKTADMFIDWN
jgi:hypothetical protein